MSLVSFDTQRHLFCALLEIVPQNLNQERVILYQSFHFHSLATVSQMLYYTLLMDG